MIPERTSLFLMANLGAEVSRIIAAQDRNDGDATHAALSRAEGIMSEISHLPDMRPRAQELDALEAAIRSLAQGHAPHAVSPAHLKAYFTPFALRLMTRR